ncbi:MAG: Flp family type IVb pilin [Anaerolineales bacterium]|nr:Flp family type IVb pilin [Anaerolineales bacterium]
MKKRPTMPLSTDEGGQGLVEYALILVLVAVVVIVILALLGPAIGDMFTNLMDSLGGES